MRNFGRWNMLTKQLVEPDSLERLEWQRESAAERLADALWARHHGPVAGGARVLTPLWYEYTPPPRPSRKEDCETHKG